MPTGPRQARITYLDDRQSAEQAGLRPGSRAFNYAVKFEEVHIEGTVPGEILIIISRADITFENTRCPMQNFAYGISGDEYLRVLRRIEYETILQLGINLMNLRVPPNHGLTWLGPDGSFAPPPTASTGTTSSSSNGVYTPQQQLRPPFLFRTARCVNLSLGRLSSKLPFQRSRASSERFSLR